MYSEIKKSVTGREVRSPSEHNGAGGYLPAPLTPTFVDPRAAPIPPHRPQQRQRIGRGLVLVDDPSTSSFKSGISAVFRSKRRAPSSKNNLSSSSSDSHSPMAPLPVVSAHSPPDDGNECPVCLEPLSFSFRLPGEKPHIVPECGHALHEVLFFLLSFILVTFLSLLSRLGLLYSRLWSSSSKNFTFKIEFGCLWGMQAANESG